MNPVEQLVSLEWLDGALCQRGTVTALHFLWQGALIGGVLWLSRLLSAACVTRYWTAVAAMLLMLLCVPVTFSLTASPPTDAYHADPSPQQRAALHDVEAHNVLAAGNSEPDFVTSHSSAALASTVPPAESISSSSNATARRWNVAQLSPYLTSAYLVGATLMLVRLTAGLGGGHRLRSRAVAAADLAVVFMVRQQAARIGLRTVPAVLLCEQVAAPVVVGVLRPTILIPASLATGLPPGDLQMLLLHELAHIRRLDLPLNLFQRIVEAVLFFHPAVWYVSRCISVERELCCDDLVVAAGCDRTSYAGALLRMAEICVAGRSFGRVNALAASVIGGRPSEFKQRILRLLAREQPPRLTRSGTVLFITLVAAMLTIPVLIPTWVRSFASEEQPQAVSDESSKSKDTQAGAEADQEPQQPAPAQGETPSLDVTILGIDGKPVDEATHVTVWRQVQAVPEKTPEREITRNPIDQTVWVLHSMSGNRTPRPDNNRMDRFQSKQLQPGTYKLTALTGGDNGMATGMAVSDAITVNEATQRLAVTLKVQPGPSVLLRFLDQETQQPIEQPTASIRLTRADGFDVERSPHSLHLSLAEDRSFRFLHLAPGKYQLRLSATTHSYGYPSYSMQPRTLTVAEGQENEFVISLRPEAVTEEQAQERWPWCVEGKVVDEKGHPLPGVAIRAARGIGSLLSTYPVYTDAEGRYRLRFGPGMLVKTETDGGWGAGVQAACIFASKEGYAEKNLCRQGDLQMADEMPREKPDADAADRFLLPNQTRRLNFIMVQAATLQGTLVDEQGQPMADQTVTLTGDELPPASGVVASAKTDAIGSFRFNDIAPGYRRWLTLPHDNNLTVNRTQSMVFQGNTQYQLQLRIVDEPATGKMLRVTSAQARKSIDVSDDLFVDDPRAAAYVDDTARNAIQQTLEQMAEVNKYWFSNLSPDVKTFSYQFHLVGREPVLINDEEYSKAKSWHREWYPKGISYTGASRVLASLRNRANFRKVQATDEEITIHFNLEKPSTVAAGSGIEETWHSFHVSRMQKGVLKLDVRRMTPISIEYGGRREIYSDYIQIDPEHFAPGRIQIVGPNLNLDFRFTIYQPNMWLCDRTIGRWAGNDAPVTWTSDVHINGAVAVPLKRQPPP